jgi:septum site-determining protein MinD
MLASLIATQAMRVGVVDAALQFARFYVSVKLKEEDIKHAIDDYLWGKYEVQEAVHDMTSQLGVDDQISITRYYITTIREVYLRYG